MTQSRAESQDRTNSLRGAIGVPGIVFMVLAAAAPLTTVAGSLPVMIATGNGAGAPLAYIVAALVLLVFSVGYAAMSRSVTDTGAFYAYVRKGLGSAPGVGAAGLALLAYTTIQAALYGLAASTLEGLIVSYGGPDIDWWIWALVLMVIVGSLGYRSINLGAKVLGVLLVAEIVLVVALVIAIFAKGGAHGVDFSSFSFSEFSSGSPGIALMFAIGSFVGFEATAIYGEEAKDPKRTVPIATYVAVIGIGLLFAVSSWALVLGFGSQEVAAAAQKNTADFTFIAATEYLGDGVSDVMMVMLVTSLLAALIAFHNAIARYLYALSRSGHLPGALKRVHPVHGSPSVGSMVQSGSAVVLVGLFAIAGADPVLQLFTWMAGEAIVAILILMVLTSVAIIVYFQRNDRDNRTWHTRVAPVLGSLGLIAITCLVLVNFTTLIAGSMALAIFLLVVIAVVFVGGMVLSRVVRSKDDEDAPREPSVV